MESLTHVPPFDVQLLGYSDAIIKELCRRCEWELGDVKINKDEELKYTLAKPSVYLFEGARFNEKKTSKISLLSALFAGIDSDSDSDDFNNDNNKNNNNNNNNNNSNLDNNIVNNNNNTFVIEISDNELNNVFNDDNNKTNTNEDDNTISNTSNTTQNSNNNKEDTFSHNENGNNNISSSSN